MPICFAARAEATGGPLGYELHSDLARYCFPSAMREDGQSLAWVNSICLLFLIVGLMGLKRPVYTALPPPPLDDTVPAIIVPPPETPVVQQEAPPEETEEVTEPTDAPQVVTLVAAPDTAAFSVPFKGPAVLAPASMASPPPLKMPPRRAPPPPPQGPVLFTQMGQARTPAPVSYPPEAVRSREQGTVMVGFRVETNGVPFDIRVLESSGSAILDRFSTEWIKKRWSFDPGEEREYKQPFVWKLR